MSIQTAPLRVHVVRAFTDNYIWLIEPMQAPSQLIAVDPGEAAPVIAALRSRGASLAAILLTHHHPDHIGGVPELLEHWPVPVIGPDDARISTRTQTAREGEHCQLPDLGLAFEILQVPGHTVSHIAFFGHGAVFCGDTLFSAGCGRMFEGNPPQMSASLSRLAALPPQTQVYCGHEYTAANLKFAAAVEPDNPAIVDYRAKVETLRAHGAASLPSSMQLETQVNPFLRCASPSVRAAAEKHANQRLNNDADVFEVLRAWKDGFR